MSTILNKVFLNSYYNNLGAKFAPFAGYSMPINFNSGIINEHIHTRNKCGLFDISHMGKMLIPMNDDNVKKLEKIIPQNLQLLSNSHSVYSFILNSFGGIVDDIIISKITIESIEYLFLVYNASRKKVDEAIIFNLITSPIIINDHSFIALQGPFSEKIICKLFPQSLELNFMQISSFVFNKENILISRTGYTGEDGFEILSPNTQIKNIVNLFTKNNDVLNCGIGCRDTLRLEAGLCLYGNELDENTSPIEANLKWAISKIRLENGDFEGYDRIAKEIEFGTSRTRIGLKSTSKSILRANMSLYNNKGCKIGKITSGGFSPTLNLSIAMGYIKNKYLGISKKIFCSIRGKMELIQVSKLPFVNINYKRS